MSPNATNSSRLQTDYGPNWLTNLKIALLFLVLTLGILWNTIIVFLIYRSKFRKAIHYLIANMAIADALVLVFGGIPATRNLFLGGMNWFSGFGTLGKITCKLVHFMEFASRLVSLFTLLIISIERFRSVRNTMHQPNTKRGRRIAIAFTWLLALAICAYLLDIYTVFEFGGTGYCFPKLLTIASWRAFLGFYMIFSSVVVIVSVVLVVLSVLTIKTLQSSQLIQSLPERQRWKRKKNIRNAVRMVVFSLVLFVILCVPYHTFLIVLCLQLASKGVNLEALFWLQYCLLWNSALSPCVYVIFLADFKQAFMTFIACRSLTRQSLQETIQDETDTMVHGTKTHGRAETSKV